MNSTLGQSVLVPLFTIPVQIWHHNMNLIRHVIELLYVAFDTWMYYVMNSVLLVLSFADSVLDTIAYVLYEYQVMASFLKISIYNNIN